MFKKNNIKDKINFIYYSNTYQIKTEKSLSHSFPDKCKYKEKHKKKQKMKYNVCMKG